MEATPRPPTPVIPAAIAAPPAPAVLEAGQTIGDASLELELVRALGQGAFSSVWLAKDVDGKLGAIELNRKSSLIRSRSSKRGRQQTLPASVPKGGEKKLEGTEVKAKLFSALGIGRKRSQVVERVSSTHSVYLREHHGGVSVGLHGHRRPSSRNPSPLRSSGEPPKKKEGRLVAVKMTDRSLCDRNDRTRVSFVREVEVLRHISHPSIVSYIHSFSTPSHHCLVLEHVGGGELFDLIDNAESHARISESLLRRMFGELCKAVGWMHGVGLVHRDIKLENILLTSHPFNDEHGVPQSPQPLIKLSDFGLSRFIDPSSPLLTTRCGSESYAAPELVTGRPYDGRETDAWSCGVVLYALVWRRLPFDRVRNREYPQAGRESKEERRALLMRIAKGEYTWPEPDDSSSGGHPDHLLEDGEEYRGQTLCRSPGVRRVVEKLLVRDPKKRTNIHDLWEDDWMTGYGAPLPPPSAPPSAGYITPAPVATHSNPSSSDDNHHYNGQALTIPNVMGHANLVESPIHSEFGGSSIGSVGSDSAMDGHEGLGGEEEDDENDECDDGVLVDGDDLGPEHVTRQELR